jgi:DNA polymerase I-like protein with 3'-5' exonuclease and polymerase domains
LLNATDALLYGAGSYKLGCIPKTLDRYMEELEELLPEIIDRISDKVEILNGMEVIQLDKKSKYLYSEDLKYKVAMGERLKKLFLKKTPALKKLTDTVKGVAKDREYLIAIDGSRLMVRHAHAALNTLLQSCGAIVMKVATINYYKKLLAEGYHGFYKSIFTNNMDFAFVLNIHDEYQVSAKPEIAPKVCEIAVQAIRDAGTILGMKCPLDGEAKVGKNWSETH